MIIISVGYAVNLTKLDAIDGNQVFVNKTSLHIGDKHKEFLFSLIGHKIVKGRKEG